MSDRLDEAAKIIDEHRVYPCEGAWYCEIDGPCDWWSWFISEHPKHVAALVLDAAESKLAAAEAAIDQGGELADAIIEYFAPNEPSDHFAADLTEWFGLRAAYDRALSTTPAEES